MPSCQSEIQRDLTILLAIHPARGCLFARTPAHLEAWMRERRLLKNSARLRGGVLESLAGSRKDRNALRSLVIGGRDRLALLARDCGERRKERI